MKIHPSITPEDAAELLDCRDHWQRWSDAECARAEKGRATWESAGAGRRVVQSLDMELQTGVVHAVRTLFPVDAREAQKR
jgi:hypothetical protein